MNLIKLLHAGIRYLCNGEITLEQAYQLLRRCNPAECTIREIKEDKQWEIENDKIRVILNEEFFGASISFWSKDDEGALFLWFMIGTPIIWLRRRVHSFKNLEGKCALVMLQRLRDIIHDTK